MYLFNNAYALPENTKSYIEKVGLYNQVIILCPTFAEAHNNLADVYENQGRFDDALV